MKSESQQPEIAEWINELLKQEEQAKEITATLGSSELGQRPTPKSWSVAHCFDHLATTLEEYRPFLEQGIIAAEAKGSSSGSGYRPGWFGRWFIAMAGEGQRKLSAPKMFQPSDHAPSGALERYLSASAALRSLLPRADQVDLNTTKFRSPATALLRFRIGEGIELMVVHNARHLRQAERARATIRGEEIVEEAVD